MIAEYLQHIRQQSDAGTEENEANDVERLRVLCAIVRQMQMDQCQTDYSDRQVHEKYEPPVEVSDDETANDRSQHWADQARNGDKAHGADKLGLGEGSRQREPADRDHHGSAASLQDAVSDEQMVHGTALPLEWPLQKQILGFR